MLGRCSSDGRSVSQGAHPLFVLLDLCVIVCWPRLDQSIPAQDRRQSDFRRSRRAWSATQKSSGIANQRRSQGRGTGRELNFDNQVLVGRNRGTTGTTEWGATGRTERSAADKDGTASLGLIQSWGASGRRYRTRKHSSDWLFIRDGTLPLPPAWLFATPGIACLGHRPSKGRRLRTNSR